MSEHSCRQGRHHCGNDRTHPPHHFDAGHGATWCCPGQRALGNKVAEKGAGVEHGTLTAYTKRDCRCDLCREFWNTYMRWWRADQRGRLHGGCPTCACLMPEKPTNPLEPTP